MARDGKKPGLTPVDDEARLPRTVIRLESEGSISRRIEPQRDLPAVAMRLDLPERDEPPIRAASPAAPESLIDGYIPLSEVVPDWDHEPHTRRRWIWLAAALAAVAVWILLPSAHQPPASPTETAAADAETEMMNRIERTIQSFFLAGDITALLPCVRHPDRVRPLMEDYYKDHPIYVSPLSNIGLLQPVEISRRPGFWMGSVELRNHERRNVLIEIAPSGKALIDWETLVCYQPMKWDDFSRSLPDGAFDFRVNMEQENFLAHDTPNAANWACFRLTAPDSEATLFGYAERDSPTARALRGVLAQNDGERTAVILRLRTMKGNSSQKGVIIEKLIAPRWIYVDPPDSSP